MIKLQLLTLVLLSSFLGCVSEKELDPNDAKKSYGIAKEPFDEGQWDSAVKRLGEFKSRFPYSQFTAEAELLIADAHYNLDHYAEAASAYDTFVKLHPKHAKADYAMFRVAESYWQDAPDVVSREQDLTEQAVKQWQLLIQKMPDSPYAKKAESYVAEGRRRLAESNQFVARFYCRRDVWHACAYRYVKLIETYPEFKDITEEAIKEGSRALEKVADAKALDPESDKNLFFKSMSAAQIREKAANLRKLSRG